MGNDDENQVKIDIEKTDDEEEVNARNEVCIEINDSDTTRNRNRRIVLKSKTKEYNEMLPDAIKAMKEDYYTTEQTNKKEKGGHFG